MAKKICALCGCKLYSETTTKHHLIPRSIFKDDANGFSNEGQIKVHHFCHAFIHILFSNPELATKYNTVAKLRQIPEVQKLRRFMNESRTEYYIRSPKSCVYLKYVIHNKINN